ncbi:MAG TPA: M64 family metallopeptidase, partial [Aquaticitalea sp.]|nr:M64 family metallopeptidase [Aquaticitalea sp.]
THPGTAPDEPTSPPVPVMNVNNFFGTQYDSYNIHRLLFSSNYALINNVLANNFPDFDIALILVNAPYYGGSGGAFAFASTDESSIEIAIHELGHSFAFLKDEYYPGDALVQEAINMTQNNNPATIRWRNWLNYNGVGIYPYGTSGTPATWYRPHQLCKMQYLGYPFCNVCKEGIIERIHGLVSPIVGYSPSQTSHTDPSLPLDISLDLVLPIPNTLATQWTLNGSDFSTNLNAITLTEPDMVLGTNTLTASITDNSELLRVDEHENFHTYTVTWTIQMNNLGIGDIISEQHTLAIKTYPNPTQDVLNVVIESQSLQNFDITLTSIDGKSIQTVRANGSSATLDLGDLSTGIYIMGISHQGTILAQKKIVKE